MLRGRPAIPKRSLEDNHLRLHLWLYLYCMRSINRVTCAVGRGVIEMSEERCPAAAQRLGNVMRQGKSAS